MNFKMDKQYVSQILQDILATDSPSGFTKAVMQKIEGHARGLGLTMAYSNRGVGILTIPGKSAKTVGLCAHVDTLGLMVRGVREDGTLTFTPVGGPLLPTLDGEYVRVYTRDGKVYTGTVLSNYPAGHVFRESTTKERDEANMHIRLDEKVKSKQDVRDLGICAGDYVCIETKTVLTESGFIKSRFLDDKLSVAIVFGVLHWMHSQNIQPACTVKIFFSSYEEVGNGLAFLPEPVSELVGVDMGCIGSDLTCTEYDVSICAKDSSGPYDYALTGRLIQLAKDNNLSYAVDIYPYYSSDVSAAWRGGNDVRGALIGAGVHASHGMERSHFDGVENTMKLLALYLGV